MPNPFFYGGKVSPNLFVGRSQQLRRVFSCLELANTGQLQSVSIVGPHRMGRSSLLNYIAAKYDQYLQSPNLYRFVYVSPHDANCHNAGEFLCKVLDALGLPLHTHHNATLQEFQEAVLLLNQNGIHPIVCLDEFEELLNTNSFSDDFFDVLRHLMSESAIAFVIASTHPLDDLVSADKYTSPFFNIFTVIKIGEFIVDQNLDEADLIVDRGRHCDRPFSDSDTKFMRKLAGRHPYKLQLAGSLIYQSKMNGIVNLKSVKKDFKVQIKQAGLTKDYSKTLLQKIKTLVISVGKALLETRRGKDEISESSALWWGIGVIIFVLLLILGVIPVGLFLKFGSHWLGK
jgi:hypothetical protein